MTEKEKMRQVAKQGDMLGFIMKADIYRNGKLKEAGEWSHNSIVNTGYSSIWNVYFKNDTNPASFELHLAASISGGFSFATVVGNITEVTGSGYAAQAIATTDWTITGNPMSCTSTQETFTATGTWDPAIGAYLTTPSAAVLICYDAFPSSRTLYSGDTLRVTAVLTREAATE